MSVALPAPLRTRLPRLSPQEARARNAWIAALDGQSLDGGRLGARIAPLAPSREAALIFAVGEARLYLIGETIDGQPAARLAEDPALPEALNELGRLESLIARVERACGRPLDPVGVGAPPASGITVELVLQAPNGDVRTRARLIAPLDLPLAAAPTRARGARFGHLRTACRVRLRGPAPTRNELAMLEAGDVVLLPRAGDRLEAVLEVGNRAWRGGFSPAGAFHIREEEIAMLDEPPSPDEAAPAEAAGSPAPASAPEPTPAALRRLAELPVRLQVALPDLHLSINELAALAPGAVAALPLRGEDLPVRLLADGAEVARGRLVALGEAYGVLIDAVSAPPATPGGEAPDEPD